MSNLVNDQPKPHHRGRPKSRNQAISGFRTYIWALAFVAGSLLAAASSAQGLHGLGGLVGGGLPLPTVGGLLGDVRGDIDRTVDDTPLRDLSQVRLRDLVRANPKALDLDDHGAAVVRGEVLALSPSPQSLAVAAKAGFQVLRESRMAALDIDLVVLSAPPGMPARDALRTLRKLDPDGLYDLDHIYTGAGVGAGGTAGATASPAEPHPAKGVRVGLLDTGVDASHPVFAGSKVEQRGFAPGGARSGPHGTEVASLMVGDGHGFHGSAPGADLLAADVYGTGPTGGSAAAIAGGLAWMAENRIGVINISLVGPPNLTLEAAVRAVITRGSLIVAPVGNDGPAAPPLYPASYPGVVAVTGVDARRKVLLEAGRASHLDFKAPGADLDAAKPGGGFETVRGTSFAAPIVAGRLAVLLREPDRVMAKHALVKLAADAGRDGGVVDRGR